MAFTTLFSNSFLFLFLLRSIYAQLPTGPDSCTKDSPYKGLFSNSQIFYDVQTHCAAILAQEPVTNCIGTKTLLTTIFPAATITGEVTKTNTVAAWTQTITSTAVIPDIHGFTSRMIGPNVPNAEMRLRRRGALQPAAASASFGAIDYPSMVHSVCFCGSAIGDWYPKSNDQMCTVTSTVTNQVYTRQARTAYVTISVGITTVTETASVTSVVSPQQSGYLLNEKDDQVWAQWSALKTQLMPQNTAPVPSTIKYSEHSHLPSETMDFPPPVQDTIWLRWPTNTLQTSYIRPTYSPTSMMSLSTDAQESWEQWIAGSMSSVAAQVPSLTTSNALQIPSVSAGGFWQQWEMSTTPAGIQQPQVSGSNTEQYSNHWSVSMWTQWIATSQVAASSNPTPTLDSPSRVNEWERWTPSTLMVTSNTAPQQIEVPSATSQFWDTWSTTSPASSSNMIQAETYAPDGGQWKQWTSTASQVLPSWTSPQANTLTPMTPLWSPWLASHSLTISWNQLQSTATSTAVPVWEGRLDSAQLQKTETTIPSSQSTLFSQVLNTNDWQNWETNISTITTSSVSPLVTSALPTILTQDAKWKEWSVGQKSSTDSWTTLIATHTETTTPSASIITAVADNNSMLPEWVAWQHARISQDNDVQHGSQPTVGHIWSTNTVTITQTAFSTITAFQTITAPQNAITVTVTATQAPNMYDNEHGRMHGGPGNWRPW